MTQSVKHRTPDFGSGDLRVLGWSLVSGSTLSRESAQDSLSLSPSLCPFPHLLSRSFSQINQSVSKSKQGSSMQF